jgi:hypothetical protein
MELYTPSAVLPALLWAVAYKYTESKRTDCDVASRCELKINVNIFPIHERKSFMRLISAQARRLCY